MSLPDPLTPPDCDLQDYRWMPLDVRKFLTSEAWMDNNPETMVATLTLLCESWCQVPCASVPDNDRILAQLSRAGFRWKRIREKVLKGWVRCSDGRLYHPVIAQKALEAMAIKIAQKQRTEAARKARKERAAASVTTSVTELVTVPVTEIVTELVTESNRTEQTIPKKERKKERAETSSLTPKPASDEPLDARTLLWRQGVPILVALTGKPASGCRSMLGQILAKLRDDCPKTLLLLQEAQTARHADPVAWLMAAAQDRQKPARPSRDERIMRAAGLWPDDDDGVVTIDQPTMKWGLLQ